MLKMGKDIASKQMLNKITQIGDGDRTRHKMTEEEMLAIEFRKKTDIEEEKLSNKEETILPVDLEEKLMQLIMEGDDQAINDREVQGSFFEGINEIIKEQKDIAEIKQEVDGRIAHISKYWDNEIKR